MTASRKEKTRMCSSVGRVSIAIDIDSGVVVLIYKWGKLIERIFDRDRTIDNNYKQFTVRAKLVI